ncbi:MAG: antibiotic biosynthesis monooxygenase family protein [Vulcanimicrobiaceae bacterium]
MIVRRFRAKATAKNAKAYAVFFRDTLTPQLKEIPGHRGALVLSEERKKNTRITVLTFWDSMDSVRRFAGDNPTVAVIEPEIKPLLSSWDDTVTHEVVEVDTRE